MGDDYTGSVTVVANDNIERDLNHNVWKHSETIVEMVKDTDLENPIPLAPVFKDALDIVEEYLEKMTEFEREGTSDEDKREWIGEYKKSMEAQEKLPLLFQTITAANFMNIPILLDELCKFVAEMIAQRTPNEILDYFNIKKDATYEEEQGLIATHTLIDPDGLIAMQYAEAAAEQERLAAEAAAAEAEAASYKQRQAARMAKIDAALARLKKNGSELGSSYR